MARRSGIVHILVKAQHDAERRRSAQQRKQAQFQTQAARAAEKARKDYERALQVEQKQHERGIQEDPKGTCQTLYKIADCSSQFAKRAA